MTSSRQQEEDQFQVVASSSLSKQARGREGLNRRLKLARGVEVATRRSQAQLKRP